MSWGRRRFQCDANILPQPLRPVGFQAFFFSWIRDLCSNACCSTRSGTQITGQYHTRARNPPNPRVPAYQQGLCTNQGWLGVPGADRDGLAAEEAIQGGEGEPQKTEGSSEDGPTSINTEYGVGTE